MPPTLVPLLLFCVGALHLSPGRTQDQHVRSTNSRVREALDEGKSRASTFRSLLEALEQSDVIVHIEVGECSCRAARSCVGFVTATGGVRYLRATVSLRQIQPELIAQIGHELFHSAEIAQAEEIVSERTLEQFYRRRGRATCGNRCGYETAEAVRAQQYVRAELETSQRNGVRIW